MEVYNYLRNLADEISVDVVSVYYFSKVDKSLAPLASYVPDIDSWGPGQT